MSLRNVIRDIVREVLSTELPALIRASLGETIRPAVVEILESELSVTPDVQGKSASKEDTAAVVASRQKTKSVPRAAGRFGVQVGQQYKARDYKTSIAGRVIQVSELLKDVVIPKVITSARGKTRTAAKPISYEALRRSYTLVK